MSALSSELALLLAQRWGMTGGSLTERHVPTQTRAVFHLRFATNDVAVKVDSFPHDSVMWGIVTQDHAAQRCPWLAPADEIDSQLAGLPFEDRARDLVARVRALPTTSQATIHGEPAASNLQSMRDGRVCLLDWDQSGRGPTVLDLGFPLINEFLSYDLRWNSQLARAFYGSYRATFDETGLASTDVFTAGLFYALRFMFFHDRAARWSRIVYAVEHEQALLDAISLLPPQVL